MTVFKNAGTNTDPHGWGRTLWCAVGRHDKCEYRIGGRLEDGIVLPECYITMPNESARGGRFYPPGVPKVVSPSHIYRCPCECHEAGQYALDLEETA